MKKSNIYIFILCFCLILFIILTVVLNNNKYDGVISNERQEYFENLSDDYYGTIDFENTDNVEIKDHQKINISPKIKEKHTFEQYEITNMEIFTIKSMCYLTFDLKNLSYKGRDFQRIVIILYDKDGSVISSIEYPVGKHIRINKTEHIIVEYLEDVSNAYDYKLDTWFK